MIKTLLFDLSRTLLFPQNRSYKGKLNSLHAKLSRQSDYHFLKHFEFNEELLEYLKKIKEKFQLCIFTSGDIQNSKEAREVIRPIFHKVFSGKKLGFSKKDPNAYLAIARKLRREPNDILFIDDNHNNLVAAKTAGLNVLLFKTNKNLVHQLDKFPK